MLRSQWPVYHIHIYRIRQIRLLTNHSTSLHRRRHYSSGTVPTTSYLIQKHTSWSDCCRQWQLHFCWFPLYFSIGRHLRRWWLFYQYRLSVSDYWSREHWTNFHYWVSNLQKHRVMLPNVYSYLQTDNYHRDEEKPPNNTYHHNYSSHDLQNLLLWYVRYILR